MNKKMCKKFIEVSNIEIVPVPPQKGLIGFVSFKLNESFFVGNIAIYTSPSSPDGFRLVYPTKMGISCFHPITREIGYLIQKKVIRQYLEIVEKLKGDSE